MAEANPCPTCGYQIDRVERLNTENARLRGALNEIANYYDDQPGEWMRGRAKRALTFEQKVTKEG